MVTATGSEPATSRFPHNDGGASRALPRPRDAGGMTQNHSLELPPTGNLWRTEQCSTSATAPGPSAHSWTRRPRPAPARLLHPGQPLATRSPRTPGAGSSSSPMPTERVRRRPAASSTATRPRHASAAFSSGTWMTSIHVLQKVRPSNERHGKDVRCHTRPFAEHDVAVVNGLRGDVPGAHDRRLRHDAALQAGIDPHRPCAPTGRGPIRAAGHGRCTGRPPGDPDIPPRPGHGRSAVRIPRRDPDPRADPSLPDQAPGAATGSAKPRRAPPSGLCLEEEKSPSSSMEKPSTSTTNPLPRCSSRNGAGRRP